MTMKYQRRLTIALLSVMLGLGACNNPPEATESNEAINPNPDNPEAVAMTDSPTADSAGDGEVLSAANETTETQPSTSLPEGIANNATLGNSPEMGWFMSAETKEGLCYVTVMDSEQQTSEVPASDRFCSDRDRFINQNLRFIYDDVNSNPQQLAISDVVMLGDNWEVLSNGTWTVTVGQMETWDGTNNTGNLTYYGCDEAQECLALEGGKVTCRDGLCSMGWRHENYFYILSTPIVEDGGAPSTLRVHQGGEDLLNAPNMEVVKSSASQS